MTYPAHWRQSAVDALRNALAAMPEFERAIPATVVSDATAALTALQNDPGVPTRGVIALCDFGGTGTSITLVDAGMGYAPLGATVRDIDLSGDLVDQALLTHVLNDLSAAGTIDLADTSAIGSLSQLRAQCRGAKERLSTSGVTSLVAELPGAPQRGTADAHRVGRRDAPAVGRLRRCTARHVGAQRSSRTCRRRVGGRRSPHPDHHHDVVRTIPGAGHHQRPTRVDRGDRWRLGGRARNGRRSEDIHGAVAPAARQPRRRWHPRWRRSPTR